MFIWSKWPPEFTLSATANFQASFPNLKPHLCANEVSSATPDYNCIAWAANSSDEWWEPDIFEQYYWPEGVPRVVTVAAFVAAYKTVGFEECDDPLPETGTEKIAIFTKNGVPTHATRLLPNGFWTSKLGPYEDIQHKTLHSVGGPLYGTPEIYMKKKLA